MTNEIQKFKQTWQWKKNSGTSKVNSKAQLLETGDIQKLTGFQLCQFGNFNGFTFWVW